jgi:periplasmic divalent cation tolerance protein
MDHNYVIVFVTTPNTVEGQKIAKKLVSEQLAACVNIVPGMTSFYTWKGEICEDNEVLLIIKTRASLFDALSAAVQVEHPYEVPEIIAAPITTGSASYLRWINEVTQQA